ncbi:hypothetical protein SmJEL517_g06129 [Synchytrium microbalum]|uniref:Major capsid protein N-terminal domain-containing protein n=1 Tax=Synchytrium microbalum TaxID=1806994 RepID=A0A507BY61_9FUNG|nr:uncharacterized protein SmJEL517_g06129 [Synchytrium microbalum]TPX30275.1 hypothetical protein SmJEL517_g06129 [Synchytrium microbalum]
MESMEQTFNGQVNFGRKATVQVARNGDLIYRTYLELDFPAVSKNSTTTQGGTPSVRWVDEPGHVILDDFYLDIGGTTIDKHYGVWLSIWNELTQTAEKEATYDIMIGHTTANTTPAQSLNAFTAYVPLIFWFEFCEPKKPFVPRFCGNTGLAQSNESGMQVKSKWIGSSAAKLLSL